jgi:hypothetical protein
VQTRNVRDFLDLIIPQNNRVKAPYSDISMVAQLPMTDRPPEIATPR